MISQVFYTRSGKWGFQYMNGFYRVYHDGKPVADFHTFVEACNFIGQNDV